MVEQAKEEVDTDKQSVDTAAAPQKNTAEIIEKLTHRVEALENSRQRVGNNGTTTILTAIVLWCLNKISHLVSRWFGF